MSLSSSSNNREIMMEKKLNFIQNGVLRLPPGFRFHPTDEELVVQYLMRKVFSFPLPASIIPVLDVWKSDPSHLPGDGGHERYFFSIREAKYPNGNRSNRATGSGYWKATGIDKQIVVSKTKQIVGMKKTLIFNRGKAPHGARADWVMHEYRLVAQPSPCNATNNKHSAPIKMKSSSNSNAQRDNWVLCRIFLKKRVTARISTNEAVKPQESRLEELFDYKKDTDGESCIKPVFYDFMRKKNVTTDLNLAPTCSSSDSSGITDVSSEEEQEESNNSCSNSFSLQR